MSCSRLLAGLLLLAPLLTFVACGGSSSSDLPPGPAAIRTLAYAVTDCHGDATGESASQRLEILQGDRPAVTVLELPTVRYPALGLCALSGRVGIGSNFTFFAPFQRLGVSPDGSGVVFEVTLDLSLVPLLGGNPLSPDQEGIFFVRADGSGLWRLGPASREPAQRLSGITSTSSECGATIFGYPFFSFSPDGRTIAFMDRGPGPAGEDAPQVVTIDIASGTRTVLTHLPDAPTDPSFPAEPATALPNFPDDNTIQFFSRANPDGLNAEGAPREFTVKTDGTGLTILPAPVARSGSQVVQTFSITIPVGNAEVTTLLLRGTPVNPNPCNPPFYNTILPDVFVLSPDHILQLTNFHRIDTNDAQGTPLPLTTDGQHVFFIASPDPLGTNPSENCQVFSIDTLGADLRQLTQFRAADHSAEGCNAFSEQPGCFIASAPILDPELRTLVINTDCDPLGTNPKNGGQYFAMHTDGTGLRQLTATQGIVTAADGSVDVELPGPGAYSAPGFGGLL